VSLSQYFRGLSKAVSGDELHPVSLRAEEFGSKIGSKNSPAVVLDDHGDGLPASVYDNDARTSDGRFQGALARSLNRLGTCFRDHGYSNGCGGPLDSLPSWLLGPD
jgi:hypothetical protein